MIRVRKSAAAPVELATKGYTCDEVKKAILADQDDKCYICERRVTTDYQVEHLASRSNNSSLVDEWSNLFIACNYCNDKKKTSFDAICHPDQYDVEDVITHTFDPMHENVIFKTASTNESIAKTVSLLSRMFNGTHAPIRTLMESRFYNLFKMQYNFFQSVINDYLAGNKTGMRPIIEEQISIESEFLAFKYAIIMQHPQLRHDFQHLIRWNKPK